MCSWHNTDATRSRHIGVRDNSRDRNRAPPASRGFPPHSRGYSARFIRGSLRGFVTMLASWKRVGRAAGRNAREPFEGCIESIFPDAHRVMFNNPISTYYYLILSNIIDRFLYVIVLNV